MTRLNAEVHAATTAHAAESSTEDLGELHSAKPWDGMVTVSPHELKAVGIKFAKVVAQTKPIKLELNGRTDYDPNTITRIRPRFDTRVEKVFASLGQKIKKGDPLVTAL